MLPIMRRPEFDEAWGQTFTDRMRDYLDTLAASLDEDDETEVDTLSGLPFCGCPDCYDRETWLLATLLAVEGYEAGNVRLVDHPDPWPNP